MLPVKLTTGYVVKELESQTYLDEDEDDDVFYLQVFPADAAKYQTKEEAEMALNRVLTKGLELGVRCTNFLKFKVVKRVKRIR